SPFSSGTQLTLHSTALCTFEPPGCKEMEVAAIAGESVQLLPLKLPESWTEITWEVTLDSAETYGIVTFHKGEPPDHGSSPHFINRVTFHPDNLSLQIDPVKKSDSGLYSLQTETGGACVTDSSRLPQHLSPGSLLSDRVRQPNLTVLSAHLELGQCSVTLFCSVPGADRVTYSWSRGTSRIPSDRDHQLPGNQSLLHVAINADSSDIFYRCNASNRASWAADTAGGKSLTSRSSGSQSTNPVSLLWRRQRKGSMARAYSWPQRGHPCRTPCPKLTGSVRVQLSLTRHSVEAYSTWRKPTNWNPKPNARRVPRRYPWPTLSNAFS
uniref:Ig-like domain-containing protein n=1 Tax=Chelonoidis abingdonii TaxID=106734 RepID=A0A8C0IXG0_CHEAB